MNRLLAMLVASTLSMTCPAPLPAAQPLGLETYRWLDVEGRPLPFQDHAAILEALRSGSVVSRHEIGRGVAGAEKLVLEHEGARFHAAFRTVDALVESEPKGGARRPMSYRDAAIFEAAAYELSELLGIGRVPPAVARSIDGTDGTVQIWMEQTTPEVELLDQGSLDPPDPGLWNRQKDIMRVFDSLIANNDRNQGNLLIDANWNIWLIDHTRAFNRSSELVDRDSITRCERGLWASLQALDEPTIRGRTQSYLKRREVRALLLRRDQLIRHIEKLIEKQGESDVLFHLPAAAPAALTAERLSAPHAATSSSESPFEPASFVEYRCEERGGKRGADPAR
ncbi:MAG TPA: hypothetical protein VLT81_14340 [Chondromyces sp.]|nr:hypothetical protein [Chondromyces sp.]